MPAWELQAQQGAGALGEAMDSPEAGRCDLGQCRSAPGHGPPASQPAAANGPGRSLTAVDALGGSLQGGAAARPRSLQPAAAAGAGLLNGVCAGAGAAEPPGAAPAGQAAARSEDDATFAAHLRCGGRPAAAASLADLHYPSEQSWAWPCSACEHVCLKIRAPLLGALTAHRRATVAQSRPAPASTTACATGVQPPASLPGLSSVCANEGSRPPRAARAGSVGASRAWSRRSRWWRRARRTGAPSSSSRAVRSQMRTPATHRGME